MYEFWDNLEKKMKILIFIVTFFTAVGGFSWGIVKYVNSKLENRVKGIVEKKISDISLNYNNQIVLKLDSIDKKIDTRFETLEEKLDSQKKDIDLLTTYFEDDKIKQIEFLVWKIQKYYENSETHPKPDLPEVEKCIEDYDKIKNKSAKTVANYEIVADYYKDNVTNKKKK